VALPDECLALRPGDRGRDRVSRFVEGHDPPRRAGRALVAGEHEHRLPDRREAVDGRRSRPEAGGVVPQRVGHRLEVGPERGRPHTGDVLLRCTGDAQEGLERHTSVAGGDHAIYLVPSDGIAVAVRLGLPITPAGPLEPVLVTA
jgi:hypothetical protein